MLEFEIGITQEELAGVFASQLPNDIAFAKGLELLVGGWRDGEAARFLKAVQLATDLEPVVAMKLLEPRLN